MASNYLAKKQLGVWSLSFIGLSSMLGSGWLLASYYVYHQAGTYSPLSWILGFSMILVIALSFAETCSMIDRDGATVILPRLSHGYFLSAMFGIFGLISWVALIPIEVAATMQYLTYFVHGLYVAPGHMSVLGFSIAIGLVILISIINSFAITWIKKLNNYIFTPIKIGIPLIIIAYSLYHAQYIPYAAMDHSHSVKGIFLALPVGVVFSFNAFKSICVIAGRAKNPQKTITFSLIISLTICLALYLGLQYAYNLNATAAVLANHSSPYASIVSSATWMLLILYIGAVSSPFTANIFNLNAGNACFYRIAKFGYLPGIFKKSNRYHQYIFANIFNMLVASYLVFKSSQWSTMVQNLTCIMVITYAAAPIALMSFRKNLASVARPIRLRCGMLIGFLGFTFSNFMIFWCGLAAITLALKALVAMSIFIIVYYKLTAQKTDLSWLRSLWVYLWLGGIGVISYYSTFGGTGQLTHPVALSCILILSVIVYALLLKCALPSEDAIHELKQIGMS